MMCKTYRLYAISNRYCEKTKVKNGKNDDNSKLENVMNPKIWFMNDKRMMIVGEFYISIIFLNK